MAIIPAVQMNPIGMAWLTITWHDEQDKYLQIPQIAQPRLRTQTQRAEPDTLCRLSHSYIPANFKKSDTQGQKPSTCQTNRHKDHAQEKHATATPIRCLRHRIGIDQPWLCFRIEQPNRWSMGILLDRGKGGLARSLSDEIAE